MKTKKGQKLIYNFELGGWVWSNNVNKTVRTWGEKCERKYKFNLLKGWETRIYNNLKKKGQL